MIDIIIDIDGVLTPRNLWSAYQYYGEFLEYLPESWRSYHVNHVVTVTHENIDYHHLLLPGVLEMLECFSVHLNDKVRISFFSAGIKERNEPFCEALMRMVAKNANVPFDSINYKVYSRGECKILPEESELQPDASNTPYIPDDCRYWGQSKEKKVLSTLFGFGNTENVILIDDQYAFIIKGETANHLKALCCQDFGSDDLKWFRGEGLSIKRQRLANQQFLKESRRFYEVNQIYYITGLLHTVISRSEELKISASAALESLQLCVKSNKYKQALMDLPIWRRYESQYYEKGFLALQKINPSLEFFAPYPRLALDALNLQKEQIAANENPISKHRFFTQREASENGDTNKPSRCIVL